MIVLFYSGNISIVFSVVTDSNPCLLVVCQILAIYEVTHLNVSVGEVAVTRIKESLLRC